MGSGIDYGEIEVVLEQIMGESFKFEQLVSEMMAGGEALSPVRWIQLLGNALIEQISRHGQTIGYLFLLILSAAILSALAKAFRNHQISDMGFYMIYLLLFLILFRSFGVCYSMTEQVVSNLVDFMKVLMPAYLMAAAAGSYRTTAVVYYEGFLLLIYYLQKFVLAVVLPGIRCYVIFALLGNLGKEEFFSRGREGLKKLILFSLKAMIGIGAGMQMIQGMISPAIDGLKQTVFTKGISSLGTLGNVAGNVTDIMLASGVLLKNSIGVAAAVAILGIGLIPVVEIAGYSLFYQIVAAAAEPVSDRRLTELLGQMGDGLGLLTKLVFSVCAMFLLTVAFVCVTTGGMG